MPRPKGSKNKVAKVAKTVLAVQTVAEIDAQIDAVNAEIAQLNETLKAKKAELKALNKAKEKSEKAAAAQKAEEEKAAILAAVAASGKSVDEILDMLK